MCSSFPCVAQSSFWCTTLRCKIQSALNFDVCTCLCLNIMLRLTNSWRQNKQVDRLLDPSSLLKVYFHYLLGHHDSLVSYLAWVVAMLSCGIGVLPLLQLTQGLLILNWVLSSGSQPLLPWAKKSSRAEGAIIEN